MTKRLYVAATAVALTLGAVPVAAQITTTIARPKTPEAVQVAAARREAAAQDSVARVTLTDMKVWVDSAANALALRPDTAGSPSDTGVAVPPPAARTDSVAAAQPTPTVTQPEFREGARPPDTATTLPSLALAGAAMIVLGVLVRRRATRATVRARR